MLSCFGIPKYAPDQLSCGFGEGFEVIVTAQMWQQSGAFEIIGKVPNVRGFE
jgi:alpha-ribazole phosphatase